MIQAAYAHLLLSRIMLVKDSGVLRKICKNIQITHMWFNVLPAYHPYLSSKHLNSQ